MMGSYRPLLCNVISFCSNSSTVCFNSIGEMKYDGHLFGVVVGDWNPFKQFEFLNKAQL